MDVKKILQAVDFAADKHRNQTRKNSEKSPYINHPIGVATVMAVEGGIDDEALLMAAVLHDTVEDTETSIDEIEAHFGTEVARLVSEVTDDKSLPKQERKRLQVEHAPHASDRARQLKLADKICNLRDLATQQPTGWSVERRLAYVDWAREVVEGCRGVNPLLEKAFDQAANEALQASAQPELSDRNKLV